ncbi:bacteriohemerythrin [Dechloromonas sp. A34]|uniref:bacteriohemerythrin n=1 Tax=Dechloromonas sp. A34 TaxID=447588 RepID=UPI0022491B0A|nr:hypothetical protein [Dechloromonas sp. A34]
MNDGAHHFLPGPLLIGVAEVDAQHDAMFRQLVVLKGLCLRDGCLPIEETDGLLAALQEHYATEERLAEEAGLDFAAHAQAHREMLELVGKAFSEVVEGRGDVFGTLRYVEYWFERHIAQDDMCLDKCSSQQLEKHP